MMNADTLATFFDAVVFRAQQLPVWIAIAALLLAALIAAGGYGLTRIARRRRAREEAAAQTVRALERRIAAQLSALATLGEQVTALEDYLQLVGDRQQRLEQSANRQSGYRQAIGLADRGAKAEHLVARCGMTGSEAELITLLYGKASR